MLCSAIIFREIMSDFASRFAPAGLKFTVFFAADGSANGLVNGEINGAASAASVNDAIRFPMNETLSVSPRVEASPDDFVDFYDLLSQPSDAPTIQLRSRINEMYAEAQANRDHRNPERRRQYATLLHWIPQARNVLLHEGKRAKYDAYATQVKSGGASANFRAYLEELIGEMDALSDGEGILGLRDATAPAPDARLSPRLDAVRVAVGEAATEAAKASLLPPTAFVIADIPSADQPFAIAGERKNDEQLSEALTPRAGTSNTPQANLSQDVGATEQPVTSRRNARSAPRPEVNPSLQRERASLLSSAIGAFVLFVVLLAARVALPDVSLAILSGISFVAGFTVWRVVRRQLLRGISRERTK